MKKFITLGISLLLITSVLTVSVTAQNEETGFSKFIDSLWNKIKQLISEPEITGGISIQQWCTSNAQCTRIGFPDCINGACGSAGGSGCVIDGFRDVLRGEQCDDALGPRIGIDCSPDLPVCTGCMCRSPPTTGPTKCGNTHLDIGEDCDESTGKTNLQCPYGLNVCVDCMCRSPPTSGSGPSGFFSCDYNLVQAKARCEFNCKGVECPSGKLEICIHECNVKQIDGCSKVSLCKSIAAGGGGGEGKKGITPEQPKEEGVIEDREIFLELYQNKLKDLKSGDISAEEARRQLEVIRLKLDDPDYEGADRAALEELEEQFVLELALPETEKRIEEGAATEARRKQELRESIREIEKLKIRTLRRIEITEDKDLKPATKGQKLEKVELKGPTTFEYGKFQKIKTSDLKEIKSGEAAIIVARKFQDFSLDPRNRFTSQGDSKTQLYKGFAKSLGLGVNEDEILFEKILQKGGKLEASLTKGKREEKKRQEDENKKVDREIAQGTRGKSKTKIIGESLNRKKKLLTQKQDKEIEQGFKLISSLLDRGETLVAKVKTDLDNNNFDGATTNILEAGRTKIDIKKTAAIIVKLDPGNFKGHSILAKGYCKEGDKAKCLKHRRDSTSYLGEGETTKAIKQIKESKFLESLIKIRLERAEAKAKEGVGCDPGESATYGLRVTCYRAYKSPTITKMKGEVLTEVSEATNPPSPEDKGEKPLKLSAPGRAVLNRDYKKEVLARSHAALILPDPNEKAFILSEGKGPSQTTIGERTPVLSRQN